MRFDDQELFHSDIYAHESGEYEVRLEPRQILTHHYSEHVGEGAHTRAPGKAQAWQESFEEVKGQGTGA